MCGSGTLLVEGVLIASDQAPGLLRDHWGFDGWLGHDEEAWRGLIEEAEDRAEAGRTRSPLVIGRDVDPAAVELARACLRRAGFRDCVQIELGDVADLEPPPDASSGLVVTNPPYGLRMKSTEDLEGLYSLLGQRLASTFEGWRAAVFTSEPHLARAIGLRSHKSYTLFNGAVRTKLYLFDLSSGNVWREVRGTARPQ
jgi:23S rRNA (guanine2445-N2)-methyltransferase / 23S rRNA (guanine2069-N7)-methyltransferase